MAYVKFFSHKYGEPKQEHLFKISRVPTIGENIYVNGKPREIVTVLHLPLSESNSIDAVCRIKD